MTTVSRATAIILASFLALSGCIELEDIFGEDERSPHTYEGSPTDPVERHPGVPLFGVSTFPGGFSAEEHNRGLEFATEDSQIFTVQRDNGIPWNEALAGTPYAKKVTDEWEIYRRERPAGMPLYLAIAPLGFDRESLIHPLDGAEMPKELRGKPFDDPNVMRAYLNHVRTCVDYFDPDYLNIGLESGELSHRNPRAWPAFVKLFKHVRDGIKSDHPDIKVGISWGLQAMMEPEAAEISRPLVDASDFVGISFYPYMSEFHEIFGSTPLPDPPGEWRVALDWLREYTDKPIAICETGYNSTDAFNKVPPIHLTGSEALQAQYIKELASIAYRDDYLFVIYYFGTDIKNLIEAMGEKGEIVLLWRENGLIDSDFNPKPALGVWRDVLKGEFTADDIGDDWAVAPRAPVNSDAGEKVVYTLPAEQIVEALQGTGSFRVVDAPTPAEGDVVRWEYDYPGDWAWALLPVQTGALKGLGRLDSSIRSNRDGAVVVQLKEKSGESFFATVNVTDQWRPLRIRFETLSLDVATRQNGRFEPEQVNQIIFSDGAGAEGQTGSRRIFLKDILGR